ncbi:MAG: pentapeptide repeat-containing protein [Candidatus Aenigmatarchaeota archaeon]
MQLIKMSPKEFTDRLIKGERDFSKINMSRTNFKDYLEDIYKYLLFQDLFKNPIILNNSDLSFIYAPGLYIPYTKGIGSDFSFSDLRGSELSGSDFSYANFFCTNLYGANIIDVNFRNADLRGAKIQYHKGLD